MTFRLGAFSLGGRLRLGHFFQIVGRFAFCRRPALWCVGSQRKLVRRRGRRLVTALERVRETGFVGDEGRLEGDRLVGTGVMRGGGPKLNRQGA